MLLAMEWDLHSLFIGCGMVGGIILGIQFLLMLLGGDHDADGGSEFEADEVGHGGNIFFTYLSIKTVVAFITFFGLSGWAAEEAALAPWLQITVALAAGLVAFYIVAFIMASFKRLESRGNVDLNNAVGKTAQVYLRIPARKSGMGKITVQVDTRSMELNAVTDGDQIDTGAPVRVLCLIGNDTVEVSPV